MSASVVASLRSMMVCGLIAVGVSCSDAPTAPSPVDHELTLAPGEARAIDEAGLTVQFVEVSGDSRCPADAVCILGGDAIARIVVESAAATLGYELHTGNLLPIRHGDVTVALVRLEPYPFSARPIEPHEYRATLRVSR